MSPTAGSLRAEASAGCVVICDDINGESIELSLLQTYRQWTLMAVLGPDDLQGFATESQFLAVLEDVSAPDGQVAFVGKGGVLLTLGKSLESTAAAGHRTDCAGVPGVRPDLTRSELLETGRDPSLAEVAAMVAPIRRLADGEGERPHTFVGSPDCSDVIPIYYDPSRATNRVNPLIVAPAIAPAVADQQLWEGLVGGWLPAVRFGYPLADGSHWESVTFAVPVPVTDYSQPAWYRYLHIADGEVLAARYVDSYLPYPDQAESAPNGFYRGLLDLHKFWSRRLAGGMRVHLPESWIEDFVRHSFVQEQITRVGDRPKYGVVDRVYGAAEHDGFPDILTTSVAANLAWGHFGLAGAYLERYFAEFVRADGSINYRGPEIGQYGRMLTVLAEYFYYTGNREFFHRHLAKIDAIAALLLDRRDRAVALDRSDPSYGLIRGRHEADISFDNPTLASYDYERPYLSNSAEAWRGFRDFGAVWQRLRTPDEHWPALDRLAAEAAPLLRDLRAGVAASWVVRAGVERLPLIAGETVLPEDAPYRSRPESYDDNRVWHELLHSGAAEEATVRRIIEAGAARGDTAFGIFGNRKLTVAFTAHGVAHALLQHDLVPEFLVLFYAHVSHCHTRGTWTAVECSDLDRDRAEHWPYCLPAQLTIPLLARWMLVFEDPTSEVLWLARATPRSWLEAGQRIVVSRAPTRHGAVSFELKSHLDEGYLSGQITVDSGTANVDGSVRLRLRTPARYLLTSVTVNGTEQPFDPDSDTVTLPSTPTADLLARYVLREPAEQLSPELSTY